MWYQIEAVQMIKIKQLAFLLQRKSLSQYKDITYKITTIGFSLFELLFIF